MRREWLLLAASVTGTLVLGLLLVRWLAPELLGVPVDLRVVQVDDRVVPFYENVFRPDAGDGDTDLLNDPYTGVRLKPFLPDEGEMGPTDALGFRNLAVPNRVDLVAIGDSQTYGTWVARHKIWSSRLSEWMGIRTYNMAVGGWGAVQYLDMFGKCLALRPRVVVVAFYTGNDPRESFRQAYGAEPWAHLRPDPTLGVGDLPRVEFPPPIEESWKVRFPGGFETVFTPSLRLASNVDHPSVAAGWAIMADVAGRIVELAKPRGVVPVFAIIPTKERVYARRVLNSSGAVPPAYTDLVDAEARNVAQLRDRITSHGAIVVDVLTGLERAAIRGKPIYQMGSDGHPTAAGHAVIAHMLLRVVRTALGDRAPASVEGLDPGGEELPDG